MSGKRKREEARRLENDRLAKLPRMCTTCNTSKPKSDFSEQQWRHPIRDDGKTCECLLCLPKEKEEEAVRLATIKEAMKHALEIYKDYKSVCYEFGGAEFSFNTEVVKNYIDLVGIYDIIFSAVFDNVIGQTQRTCNGTLTITPSTAKKEDSDSQNGICVCVDADVIMDENATDTENSMFGINFTLKRLVGGDVAENCGDEVQATVKEINSRVGLPWLDPLSDLSFTIEEATALFRSKLSTNYEKSWIVNHLPISNTDIAKKIHEYASPWKPDPVFYVEKGDLLIEVIFDESFHDRIESYLIARRRVELK